MKTLEEVEQLVKDGWIEYPNKVDSQGKFRTFYRVTGKKVELKGLDFSDRPQDLNVTYTLPNKK